MRASRFVFLLSLNAAAASLSAQSSPAAIVYALPPSAGALPSTSSVRFGDELMEYDGVVSVVPLRAGGIVVANGGTTQIRFFDRNGRLVREVGRGGGGPGEYMDIGGVVALPGDTLLVWDGIARRATVLTPAGAYVRAFALEAPFEGGGSVTRVVALASGDVLIGFSEVRTTAPSASARSFGERLVQFSSTGQRRTGTELRLASSDRFVQTVPPEFGGVAYWDLAFGRTLTVQPTASGVAIGDGTSWEIEVRSSPEYATRSRHRLDRTPALVTPADIAAFRERALRGERGASRVIAERMVDEMPFPKSQPAYVRFNTDEHDNLWIEDYLTRRDSTAVWYRLSPATRRAVAIRMPPRFEPFAFAEGLVLGVLRDQDDVERVVGFSVRTVR